MNYRLYILGDDLLKNLRFFPGSQYDYWLSDPLLGENKMSEERINWMDSFPPAVRNMALAEASRIKTQMENRLGPELRLTKRQLHGLGAGIFEASIISMSYALNSLKDVDGGTDEESKDTEQEQE